MNLEITLPGLYPPAEILEMAGAIDCPSLDRFVTKGSARALDVAIGDLLRARYWRGSLLRLCENRLRSAGRLGDAAPGVRRYLATPMTARIDMDSMLILGPSSLDLSPADRDGLEDVMNSLMEPDGVVFHHVDETMWLVEIADGPDNFEAPGVWDMEGNRRDLGYEGPDAVAALAIVNQSQVLLHEHPWNVERERRELPPVSCFVFWKDTVGEADVDDLLIAGRFPFPVALDRSDLDRASDLGAEGDDPFAYRAPKVLEIPSPTFEDLMRAARNLKADGHGDPTIRLHAGDLQESVLYGDVALWKETLGRVEHLIIEPATRALDRGDLSSVSLVAPEGDITLTKSSAWRFWRRRARYQGRFP